jgi:cbb3-type cytochrome oxidase maturation protein
MDILFLLVPFSVLVVFALLAVFAWALKSGQYDDIEREGARILRSDRPGVDVDQAADGTRVEQSVASRRSVPPQEQ